ncbi:hypothetical protein [[Eubacterium] cellulosolvens]
MIFFLLLITFVIFSTFNTTSAQTAEESLNAIKDAYDNEQFSGTLKMEWTLPTDVIEVKIIFFKGTEKKTESTDKVVSGTWSFETDVSSWVVGEYNVKLLAHDINGSVIGETNFKIRVETGVEPGPQQGEIFEDKFIKKFKDKTFSDDLKMSTTLPDDIYSVQVRISKDGKVKVDKTSSDLDNAWSYKTSVKDWDEGKYDVLLIAKNITGDNQDTASFQIKVEQEEPFYMPLVCAVLLIIFIILLIVFFILSILKHKKLMKNLKFEPKNVVKKLPMMAYVAMFITLLLVLAGLSACITGSLDLIPFILFLITLGFLMLVTYWTFANRNLPPFILYLILIILSLIVVSLAAVWSEADAVGLAVGAGLVLTALILYFIAILIYWLTSRRGFLIALVTVILSLVFFIIMIVFVVLSSINFLADWWITLIIGSVLLSLLLLITWMVLRDDIFYFQTRDESKTHRGWRKSMNMFDLLSTPRGLFKRDYDPKVMGKISYEETHDKNVRMEVISLRDWESLPGKSQGRRLMGVFVKKMRSKEGPPFNKEPVAKGVKYSIYSSDIKVKDKLDLSRAFGFEVKESGKERGLDYYDLELVHKPFLGLGTPMGSPTKKKDYDKDSGYARDSDKEKDREREHRYDYEHERKREEEDRRARSDYERESRRERGREREPDEDLEDWGGYDKDRGRRKPREDSYYGSGYDDDKERGRSKREPSHERRPAPERKEPPPEKPKKRPPPPKIVGAS